MREDRSPRDINLWDTTREDRSPRDINLSCYENIFAQLWAWFLLGGIFLQLPYLIGSSGTWPVYKIYTIVTLFIGLLVILFLFAVKLQDQSYSGVNINIQHYRQIKLQKHHFFVIVVNGIGISIYSLLHMITIFSNYTALEDPSCNEEFSCGIFHILTFLLIYSQILIFYHISGNKIPNTIIYKTMFTFLMVVNLLCFTTILTNEIKNLLTDVNSTCIVVPNKTDATPINPFAISEDATTHTEIKIFSEDFKVQPINLQINGLFVAFALGYFFMAAYLMFNFCSQMSQPNQLENDIQQQQQFSFQHLYHSVRRWSCCKNEETEPLVFRETPSISELIPFVKIFLTPSGVLIGSILSLLFLSSNIYVDYKIMDTRKSDPLTLYYRLSIITSCLNQIVIIVSTFIAFNSIRSITRFRSIQCNNYEETKGDKIFIIFAHCGSIFENLLGFYALFLIHASTDNSLLIIFGTDYALGFINAAIQTHFVLCGLNLKVNSTDETDNHDEQQRRQIAQTLRRVSIVCGMLNLSTSIVYLYETQQNYFNIITEKAYGNGETWQSIQLFINPVLIFYRFYSSVCIFKITTEFSNIKQIAVVHSIEDNDNTSLGGSIMQSREDAPNYYSRIWNIDQIQSNNFQAIHHERVPVEKSEVVTHYNNISPTEIKQICT